MKKKMVSFVFVAMLGIATAQTLPQYIMLHGLSNNGSVFTDRTQTPDNRVPPPSAFRDRLISGGNAFVTHATPTTDTTLGFTEQVRSFGNEFDRINPNKAVLIGHSQGGLRSRYFTQYFNSNPSRVYGLITMSTPNYGAPFINNIRNQGAYLDTQSVACHGAPAFTSALYSAAGLRGNETGLTDMIPGSTILNQLNAQVRMIRWGSTWFMIGSGTTPPGFQKIPSHIYTASIVGTNNVFSSMSSAAIQGFTYMRNVSVIQRNLWSFQNLFWINQWRIDGCNRIIDAMSSPDSWWQNNIVGGSQGDATVIKASQNIYQGAGTSVLGGRGAFYYEVTATHGGDNHILGKKDTITKVIDYQSRTGLPLSVTP
jgi:pimeloyl-ACP methyl ester carboxylesterase